MIDLAKYLGVDDSDFAIPFGMVDEVIDNGTGPIIAVRYIPTTSEESERIKENLRRIGRQIRARVEGTG